MSVELRIGEDAVGGKLVRSIYADLVNLPDPLKLGLTVRIFNYDNVTLYMRVDGYATGWTFTSNDIGSLASGANMYNNLDNFGTRAKPTAAISETITVRLRAYTDAGYTALKWTFERVVDIVLIKSDDGSWTQDVLNDFDDGTAQGWTAVTEANTAVTVTVATDYVLSTPYSFRMNSVGGIPGTDPKRSRTYKSFTTPNRPTIYAIFDVRQGMLAGSEGLRFKNLRFQTDGTILVYLGRPFDTVTTHYTPYNKWMRIVAPLPLNTTLEIRIVQEWWTDSARTAYLWLDDFKIISKD